MGNLNSFLKVKQSIFSYYQLQGSRSNGWHIVGTTGNSDDSRLSSIYRFSLKRPTILVVGNEGKGIRPGVLENCETLLTIDGNSSGVVDSLNVRFCSAFPFLLLLQRCCWDIIESFVSKEFPRKSRNLARDFSLSWSVSTFVLISTSYRGTYEKMQIHSASIARWMGDENNVTQFHYFRRTNSSSTRLPVFPIKNTRSSFCVTSHLVYPYSVSFRYSQMWGGGKRKSFLVSPIPAIPITMWVTPSKVHCPLASGQDRWYWASKPRSKKKTRVHCERVPRQRGRLYIWGEEANVR